MSKKDEYCATMESEIKKWDGEVDKLNAKGKQVSADLRVGYDTQLKAMRADRDLAYSKLQEVRTANESAWQHMQAGVDAAIDQGKVTEFFEGSLRIRFSADGQRRSATQEMSARDHGMAANHE